MIVLHANRAAVVSQKTLDALGWYRGALENGVKEFVKDRCGGYAVAAPTGRLPTRRS